MHHALFIRRFACAAVVASGLAVLMAAEDASLTPRAGLLLLRNGEALAGNVARVGDQYHVSIDTGELRVRASEVEAFCRDWEEGYAWRRSRIDSGQVQDHLTLAEWCLRHKLMGHAAEEISEALAIDPTHPKIGLLERRLKLATAGKPVTSVTATPAQPLPSNDDLDRMVQGLPPGTVEMFTSTVQPLLLNNCASAACHGASATGELRLARLPPGRTISRRLTQRNLFSALKSIDRNNPGDSRLLRAPIEPHGTSQIAVFSPRDAVKFQQLAAWVRQVAASAESVRPASIDLPAPLSQPATRPPAADDSSDEEFDEAEFDDIGDDDDWQYTPTDEDIAEYERYSQAAAVENGEEGEDSSVDEVPSADEPIDIMDDDGEIPEDASDVGPSTADDGPLPDELPAPSVPGNSGPAGEEDTEIPSADEVFGSGQRIQGNRPVEESPRPRDGDAVKKKAGSSGATAGSARGKPPRRGTSAKSAAASSPAAPDPFDPAPFNQRFFPPEKD